MQILFRELLGFRRAIHPQRVRHVQRVVQLESLEERITMCAPNVMDGSSGLTSGFNAAASSSNHGSDMRADIPDQVFAPYVDATLWPPFDFVELAREEDVKYVSLAFVVADPATSEPSWGGYYSVDSDYRGDQIDALRDLGGEVMVSFGGAAGTPLASAIPNVTNLTQAYQAVIEQYDLTWIDFDVEGFWVTDGASIDRRSQAIRNLQDHAAMAGKPLEVWFTLPVLPSGLTADGLNVVKSALFHGVDIGGVNIMAMNYGDSAAPNPEGQMGDYAIEAAESLFEQMRGVYDAAGVPVTDSELWGLIGVTPMIGQNDVMSERFYLEDAEKLLGFADDVGMGFLSGWSANRDAPCETFGSLSLTCSGVPQEPFEFAQTLGQFTTGGGTDGMMPSISVSDVVVTEGTAGNFSTGALSTIGNQIVDESGQSVRLAGVNWFGFETRNFAPHGLWSRGYVEMMNQMKAEGFNTIRLPYSDELFDAGSTPNGIDFSKNPDLQGLSGLEIMDRIVAHADELGMRVILDHHRSEAGNSANDSGLWYSAEYPESVWIEHLTQLATRYANNSSVVGIDLHNEPHGPATWGDDSANDWRLAAERAGNAVLAVNPDLLIIVEGVEVASSGSYWWGGNLSNAGDAPVRLDVANKLVYSAHDYPASVYQQAYFTDPAYPDNLTAIWDENWGYLFRNGIAPVLVGEFGSKLETVSDQQWFDAMVEYLKGDLDGDGENDLEYGQEGISWTYWSWNPNSGDTGGILKDDWETIHDHKVDALEPIQSDFADVGGDSWTVAFVTVSLSDASMHTTTVDYTTANGTAVSESDYTATSGTLTFLPGEVKKKIRVLVNPDALVEPDELFYFNLTNAANGSLADASAKITIVDDDNTGPSLPTLSVSDASVTEGNTGTTPMSFKVTLSEAASEDVTVDYATTAGSAVAPDDYTDVKGTLTIPAGQIEQTIDVDVSGDLLEEDMESFQISLTNAFNATLADANAEGIIVDNDQTAVPAGFTYRTTDDWGSGFNGEITLTNRGDEAWSGWRLEFDWTHEISQVWNALLIENSLGSFVIDNEFWNGEVGPGQSVIIGMSGSPGNVTTTPSNVYVNGVPADVGQSAPTLSVADVSLDEGDSGASNAEMVVSLSKVASEDVTVNYTTKDGSALAGSDYESKMGSLTIPAGNLSAVITLNVNGDVNVENDETLTVELSSPQNAVIAKGVATITIKNDDLGSSNNSAEYRTVNDWGTGFTGQLKLTNRTDQAWDGWEVEFDWEHNLTHFWSSKLVDHSGQHYVVKNESWNGKVQPGASVTLGFSGNPGNVVTSPRNITINGQREGGNDDSGDDTIEMTVSDSAIVEPDAGTEALSFTIKLSKAVPEGGLTSVYYSTVGVTAVAGEDFVPTQGTLTFLAGEMEKTIEVLVKGDTAFEADETFELALSQVVNATLVDNSAIGTIQNNDSAGSSGDIAWSVSSQWGTGYVASIVITNNGEHSWNGWELEFDSPHQIDNIWGAQIVSHVGTRYRLRALSWNASVAPSGRVNIGYQVNTSEPLEPTNFLLKTT